MMVPYKPKDDDTGTGKKWKKYEPETYIDLRERNITQDYFWYFDLRGKLKIRDDHAPYPYKGRIPIPYIRESIEEDPDKDFTISHLRYYNEKGKRPLAYVTVSYNLTKKQGFLNERIEDTGSIDKVRAMVYYLFGGGWKNYTDYTGVEEDRKKRKSVTKSKRNIRKKPVKKVIKKKIIKRKK